MRVTAERRQFWTIVGGRQQEFARVEKALAGQLGLRHFSLEDGVQFSNSDSRKMVASIASSAVVLIVCGNANHKQYVKARQTSRRCGVPIKIVQKLTMGNLEKLFNQDI